jgi:DNA-directed RNA polymerase subunit H (RpoH/RPB5)
LKIILQKITSTNKTSELSEFLSSFEGSTKIVVARDFNKKIIEHVAKGHAQIFREANLMSDLLEYCDQPKFEILSQKETAMYYQEYNTSNYTTPKFSRTDPVVKYFGLRKGAVVRIIRPSPASGESIGYRVVL